MQKSNKKGVRCTHPKEELLLAEGLAVGALVHGGVTLVGSDQNTVQSTVVCITAVVCALLNGAFDALVCFTIHCQFLLFR